MMVSSFTPQELWTEDKQDLNHGQGSIYCVGGEEWRHVSSEPGKSQIHSLCGLQDTIADTLQLLQNLLLSQLITQLTSLHF